MMDVAHIKPGALIRHPRTGVYVIVSYGMLRDELTGEWHNAARYMPQGTSNGPEYYRTWADIAANFTLEK